jgi:hypothetical protein
MDGRIAAMDGRIGSMEGRIMAKINDGFERVVNRLSSLERDFLNTKSFLVEDAVVSSRRWLDMDERVTKLERRDET